MFVKKVSAVLAAAAVIMATAALAQKPAATAAAQPSATVPEGGVPKYVRAETAEQRRVRLGTAEDPGLNPDPNVHYWRFGKSYHIGRFERQFAIYVPNEENMVRPLGMVNFAYEIYQQNEKYVWCWIEDIDEPKVQQTMAAEAARTSRFTPAELTMLGRMRSEFSALTPSESGKTITFTQSSTGLPQSGSWRNTLAVADMNEDGFPDIVTPAARKGDGSPYIFLGDGKGGWRLWREVTWPHTIDYGGVAVGDFIKDKHVDIVFGVHLNGVYVFLGDGKGHFTESSEGLPRDFPTRRVAVADVDGDGYDDILASTEGPSAVDENNPNAKVYGRLRAYVNRKKGMAWEGINVTDPELFIGGDWLSIGNFNSDRYPDLIASSIYLGANQVAHLSVGPKKWKTFEADGELLPAGSYYLASTVGKFEKKNDEAIITYTRFWPTDLDTRVLATPPLTEVTSVDRLVFTKDGLKRMPIMRWGGHAGVRGVASGDFDGDRNLDVIVTREELDSREVIILLGDGKGNFTKARVEGLGLEDNNVYDIRVADVNGDRRPDVLLMYETREVRRDDLMRMPLGSKSGSIKVFLNGGASRPSPDVKASK